MLLTLIVANNILTEAALSFLGVGVPVLTPSLGEHHPAGLLVDRDGAGADDRARHRDHAHRRVAERARRRAARRARPARPDSGSRADVLAVILSRAARPRDRGALRDLGAGVPDLQRHPRRRPGAAHRRPPPDPAEHPPDPQGLGLRPAARRAVRRHDGAALHQARPDLATRIRRRSSRPSSAASRARSRWRSARPSSGSYSRRHDRRALGRAAGQVARPDAHDRSRSRGCRSRSSGWAPCCSTCSRSSTTPGRSSTGSRPAATCRSADDPAGWFSAPVPAVDRAVGRLDRLLRAGGASVAARRAEPRLRAHGPGEGALGAAGAHAAHASQLPDPGRDAVRARPRRRRRRHRDPDRAHLRASRASASTPRSPSRISTCRR